MRAELSMLEDKAFALYLMDFAYSSGSNLGKVGRSIFEGNKPDAERVKLAIKELGNGNLSNELKARYGKDDIMSENKMAEWVKQNCKFAAIQSIPMDRADPNDPQGPRLPFGGVEQIIRKVANDVIQQYGTAKGIGPHQVDEILVRNLGNDPMVSNFQARQEMVQDILTILRSQSDSAMGPQIR